MPTARLRSGPRPHSSYDLTPTNPQWALWVQPVVAILRSGPAKTSTITRQVAVISPAAVLGAHFLGLARSKRVRLVGGVSNALVWLEDQGVITYNTEGYWVLTNEPKWPALAVQLAQKHDPELLGPGTMGPVVKRRKAFLGGLRALGAKPRQLPTLTGLPSYRVSCYA